jgi:hypothetical protein
MTNNKACLKTRHDLHRTSITPFLEPVLLKFLTHAWNFLYGLTGALVWGLSLIGMAIISTVKCHCARRRIPRILTNYFGWLAWGGMCPCRQILRTHSSSTFSTRILKLSEQCIWDLLSSGILFFFFCGEGPRSRSYGRTADLRLIVQPCDEDEEKDDQFFLIVPSNGARVEWIWQGKTEVLGEKPVPLPLCSPQIRHELARDRTRASAVGSRRLTAWAMARPSWIITVHHMSSDLWPLKMRPLRGHETLGNRLPQCLRRTETSTCNVYRLHTDLLFLSWIKQDSLQWRLRPTGQFLNSAQ